MKNMFDLMKQAKEMQSRMMKMQEEVTALEAEGASGGGLVKVRLNGKSDLVALSIDPSLIKADEAEILEDLIVAAHADARSKLEGVLQQKMQEATGGLGLPPGFGV